MAESNEHANLVSILHKHIAEQFSDGDWNRVVTDTRSIHISTRPPSISGYVPDAYFILNDTGAVVIGEAKSLNDLENSHTESQITAFLRRCMQAEGSAFILAVPWPIERQARSYLSRLQAELGAPHIQTSILSEVSR